jgi:hypothetical protein
LEEPLHQLFVIETPVECLRLGYVSHLGGGFVCTLLA